LVVSRYRPSWHQDLLPCTRSRVASFLKVANSACCTSRA
jgi:hypothetical protein